MFSEHCIPSQPLVVYLLFAMRMLYLCTSKTGAACGRKVTFRFLPLHDDSASTPHLGEAYEGFSSIGSVGAFRQSYCDKRTSSAANLHVVCLLHEKLNCNFPSHDAHPISRYDEPKKCPTAFKPRWGAMRWLVGRSILWPSRGYSGIKWV